MSTDYCERCDLPLSTCVHGMPKPPPSPAVPVARTPRATPVRTKRVTPAASAAPSVEKRTVARRWTPPEAFAQVIVDVLSAAGGALPADEALAQVEARTAERLLPGDHETTPEGELRWRYAARRARQALIAEGTMAKGAPGVWQLA